MRLAGGNGSDFVGRVEISYGGEWGTICDNRWSLSDNSVICTMLGYKAPTKMPTVGAIAEGTGKIWLSDIDCIGSENHIQECHHGAWGEIKCNHSEDVAVICEGLLHEYKEINLMAIQVDLRDVL